MTPPAAKPASSSDTSQFAAHYVLRPAADGRTLHMKACFTGKLPQSLRPGAASCVPFIENARQGQQALVVHKGRLTLDGAGDACVHYDVDVDRAIREASSSVAAREAQTALLSTDLWLWHPRDRRVRLEVDAPSAVHVALPFAEVTERPMDVDDGRVVYDVPTTSYRWRSTSAFGAFRSFAVDVGRGMVDVHLLHPDLDEKGVRAWMEAAASSVTTVAGRFPRRRVQVFVRKAALGGEPVVFGMVARGGGPVATFFVADDDKQALVGEWVGVHELAHLLTPYIQRQDAWMSEGVATWYQNIARMRSGLLSKEECWAKMVDGFARGRRAASSSSTVQQASARMHETFAYTYVYWAGTAAALLLDVQARVQSNGAWSLDRASDAVLDDAVAAQKRLTAKRYAELLDQAAGTDMFVDGVVRVERTQGFPDVQQVLWKLGVHEKHDGTVWLDDKAEWAWVRHAIERPVAAPATPKQKTASTTSR